MLSKYGDSLGKCDVKKQALGSNIKETLSWKATIRNNKNRSITLKIQDQVPVSWTKEIDVEILEVPDAKLDTESRLMEWKINLGSKETADYIIKFAVKHPKGKRLLID